MTAYAVIHKKNWPIITRDGSTRLLRVFSTIEEAEEARLEMENKTKSHMMFRVRYDDLIILKVEKL